MNRASWLPATAGLLLAACGGPEAPPLVRVPGGTFDLGSRNPAARNPPHKATLAAFSIATRETTVAEFARYLDESGSTPGLIPHPDLRVRDSQWIPAPGRARRPITCVTRAEAADYCAWLSAETGRRVRLPTEDEWEAAARGGLRGAPWPWGWGGPAGRAVLDRPGPERAGSTPPNPRGLRDMAGNVFEWCAGDAEGGIPARGGAWSERDPAMGEVSRRFAFRDDYRGADTGFRVAAD
jgi:formylglycine-generating enzyme required for sulfatase activity